MPDEAGETAENTLPVCFACAFDDLGTPCRNAAGGMDFAKIAAALVRSQRAYINETVDEAVEAETRWATDCAFEIEEHHPHQVLPLIIAAMDACISVEEAAYIAAGLLENAVVKHGTQLIGTFEELAQRSNKFRYILSGIWSQGRVDPEVWARIGKAVADGGRMSDDGRGPWDGNPVTVLSDEEALEVLKERVADAAAGMV